MSTIWNYPITTEYGWVKNYPLHTNPNDPAIPVSERPKYPGAGYGFHTGNDWGAPDNTDVTVNGIIIAKSNHTGASIGPHCHVGRLVGGVCTDPHHGGRTIPGAVVTQVSEDNINGKFVRIKASDGADWIFDHLLNQLVNVGQVLQGGDMPDIWNSGDSVNFSNKVFGEVNVPRAIKNQEGKSFKDAVYAIIDDPNLINEYVKTNGGDNVNVKRALGIDPSAQPDLTNQPWKSVWYNYAAKNIPNSDQAEVLKPGNYRVI